MPPSRRRSGNASTSRQTNQPTLRFGTTKNRVSKPLSGPSISSEKKQKDATPPVSTDIVHPARSRSNSPSPPQPAGPTSKPDEKPTTTQLEPTDASLYSENLVREQARVETHQPKTEEDQRAQALTSADIKRYWQAEEDKRIAPRVHQKDLSLSEKILRHFDLSNQYGPCIGIARLKRWRRANGLDLNPPLEVLAVLLQEEARGSANEKAYMDELLS